MDNPIDIRYGAIVYSTAFAVKRLQLQVLPDWDDDQSERKS
jgi:hypothetical protein